MADHRPPLPLVHDDYLSIDDILASQEKIRCKMETTLHNMGALDSTNSDPHIAEGAKLDLPLWLASHLSSMRRKVVSVEVPRYYRESYRDIYRADSNVLDLHKMGPYFYSVGLKLQTLDTGESTAIANSIFEVFLNRLRHLMDRSLHSISGDTNTYLQHLDETERALFHTGYQAVNNMELWKLGFSSKPSRYGPAGSSSKRNRA